MSIIESEEREEAEYRKWLEARRRAEDKED